MRQNKIADDMISLPRERMDQLVKRFDMLEAQMAAGPTPKPM